ncbi:MAG: phosphopantetheine-binding protein [Christensenellales bacterium]|jgi:acyl carrier protein
MLEQVIQIIRGQLEEPGLALSAQTNLLTDLQLNSLELVELVCALEDAFELEVPEKDLRKFVTIGDVASYLERR